MQYADIVTVYHTLESTTKRLQKTYYTAKFLKIISDNDLETVLLLLQGIPFPIWDQRKIGFADKLVIKAITLATGLSTRDVEESWKKTGDLGTTAEHCATRKKQTTLFSEPLTIHKVLDTLQKLALLEGEGTVDRKIHLAAELLTSAQPSEAKYITRTLLEDLRIGLGNGNLRDAIVWACFGTELNLTYNFSQNDFALTDTQRKTYAAYVAIVQEAYDLTNDFAHVIAYARKSMSALKNINLEPGKPCNVMLYQKANDIPDAFDTVGIPAAAEYKYDGFRMQIHKHGTTIILFTRRLEDVTHQFPDVVELIRNHVSGESFIIDAEIVGYDTKTHRYIPFQNISQRIKRKHDISAMIKEFPVEINVFDILFHENTSLLKKPFHERRTLLTSILTPTHALNPACQKIVSTQPEAEEFYHQSLLLGCEGIMMKNLQGIYQPGSRVGYGVKVKPVMETLDVVITRAEWGEGKRSEWLSSFTISVRNDVGELIEIGKVGTGIKEKSEEGVSFSQITELLKPTIINTTERTVLVKPCIVIEVRYEEIQKSPTYTSGYALRFPRFLRLRTDRGINDISNLRDVEHLYEHQRGRST